MVTKLLDKSISFVVDKKFNQNCSQKLEFTDNILIIDDIGLS